VNKDNRGAIIVDKSEIEDLHVVYPGFSYDAEVSLPHLSYPDKQVLLLYKIQLCSVKGMLFK
jgi:hypothetical protein